jgi:hypothetical protein
MTLTLPVSAHRAAASFRRNLAFGGRTQRHASAASLGKTDGNSLPGRASAMLALANVVHFFAHKFSGLSRCGFALPSVTPGTFESLFFWHKSILLVNRLFH